MRLVKVILFSYFCSCVSLFARETQMAEYLENEQKELSQSIDFHLTDRNPLRNASVNLVSQDAWLFFDNLRPSEVIEKYASMIKVSGETLLPGENGRVDIYMQGTVVIPHSMSYTPLEVWIGENYSGETKAYLIDSCYQNLETFDNAIQSIKLKRGYMATLANESNGQGYSRVFIADKEDINIPILQHELKGKISYIRCFRWEYVSKKGWCGTGNGTLYTDLDLTGSTWFYSWSADQNTTDDSEYVLIKQNKGWPDFPAINPKKNITHLLGYNEPDRPEQANASVETAINQWPKMMESGLRLGTPAIADKLDWLYSFVDECKKRNYRVDFVAVHAYWGGSGGAQVVTDGNGNIDPGKWYQKLKAIHDRTGLPIWITEWNNGANWTKETWPEDEDEQFQKQLNDLKAIINVLDTTSFIERYSIYNWVDRTDKETGKRIQSRALVMGEDENGALTAGGKINRRLTPAGEFYHNNKAPMAYNAAMAVEPFWNVIAPEAKAMFEPDNRSVKVSWTDFNGEVTDEYTVERKTDNGEWETLNTGKGQVSNAYSDNMVWNAGETHKYTYRIKIKSGNTEKYSNEVIIDLPVVKGSADIRYGYADLSDLAWKYFYFADAYEESPAVVIGGFDSENRTLLSYALQGITPTEFRLRIYPWEYQNLEVLSKPETVPYLAVKKGNYNWGDLAVEAGGIKNVNDSWTKVTFAQPFTEVPVVFVSPSSAKSSYPVYPRVGNVTKEGFEVHLTREAAEDGSFKRENLNYFAILPGSTTVGGKKILVSNTDGVGELSKKADISFGGTFANPAFYSAIQTSNDDYTVAVRYSGLTSEGVTVLKQREKSVGAGGSVSTDRIGWIVIEDGGFGTGIDEIRFDKRNAFTVYPSITDGELNVMAEPGTRINIYNVNGVLTKTLVYAGTSFYVNDLSSGIYILRTDKGETQRFILKD